MTVCLICYELQVACLWITMFELNGTEHVRFMYLDVDRIEDLFNDAIHADTHCFCATNPLGFLACIA
jgi:hypothetical protein